MADGVRTAEDPVVGNEEPERHLFQSGKGIQRVFRTVEVIQLHAAETVERRKAESGEIERFPVFRPAQKLEKEGEVLFRDPVPGEGKKPDQDVVFRIFIEDQGNDPREGPEDPADRTGAVFLPETGRKISLASDPARPGSGQTGPFSRPDRHPY